MVEIEYVKNDDSFVIAKVWHLLNKLIEVARCKILYNIAFGALHLTSFDFLLSTCISGVSL